MKKIFFLIAIPCLLFSQELPRCGYDLIVSHYQKLNPNYKQSIDIVFDQAKEWSKNHSVNSNSDTLLRLPVVVHVVYKNEDENISDAIIKSQIDVLNEDYRRMNADTINTREEFDSLAGRANFEFFLATSDPNGNPTNGITRTSTNTTSFLDQSVFSNPYSAIMHSMKSPITGGVSGWPNDKYINIWVCDISINGQVQILGYATPPDNLPNWQGEPPTPAEHDGLVIHYELFGRDATVNFGTPVAFLGRVATHEMGHYLGLRHIWGDGPCNDDDGIDDTPFSDSDSQNSCNHTKNSCVDTPYDFHDMVENYMDYSSPSCQNIFTKGQMGLMHGVLANQRENLPQQTLVESHQYSSFSVYPNPTKERLNIELKSTDVASELQLFDLSGKIIWQRELQQNDYQHSIQIETTNFASGIYFLKLKSKFLLSRTQKVIIN